MESQEVQHFQREENSTKAFLNACDHLALTEHALSSDVEFICTDGKVSAHQFILATHSEFLRVLFNRFQELEFSVSDWSTGQMFLLDRRRGTEVLHINVPDIEKKHIKMMLDLFYRGTVNLRQGEEAAGLKDVWKTLLIDTIRLETLDVISEVTLSETREGVDRTLDTHEQLLTTIKTEIVDEVEALVDLKSGLEVECEICKDTFKEEEDMLRHMEFSHSDKRSMYDKIKYKRSKADEDEKHPKDKGKGKGKGKGKSTIETKPIRKEVIPLIENVPKNVDEHKSPSKTPSPDPEDNSISVSEQPNEDSNESPPESITIEEIPLEPEEPRAVKKDKKGGKKTKSSVTTEMVRKADIVIKEKRAAEQPSVEEPSPKKAKTVNDRPSIKEVEENEVEEEKTEEEQTWDDIECLVCDQEVTVFLEKPGHNRRKYQMHLLTHFYDTQYPEIPEGLRVYQCSYKDCSYAGGSRNPYIHHIAFKHDEWYRRINRRVDQAMKNPDIGDELEELSAVKEVFLTDYRIIPEARNGNVKPLWVEGSALGREAEKEVEKQKEVDLGKEIEKDPVKDKGNKIDKEKEINKEKEQLPSVESGRMSKMLIRTETHKENENILLQHQVVDEVQKEKKLLSAMESKNKNSISKPTTSSPLKADKPRTPIEDPTKELRCRLCPKVMKIDPTKVSKNRQSFQMHLMESHFVETMFNDIPTMSKYYCPYRACEFPGAETKERFRVHLAFTHKEFSKRINRKITELMAGADPSSNMTELQTLRDIKDFFQKDPRVLSTSDSGKTWASGELLHSTQDMINAGPPIPKNQILTQSTIHTPVKEGHMGTVNVEISADLIQQLKAEAIKEEPGLQLGTLPLAVLPEAMSLPEISVKASAVPEHPQTFLLPQNPPQIKHQNPAQPQQHHNLPQPPTPLPTAYLPHPPTPMPSAYLPHPPTPLPNAYLPQPPIPQPTAHLPQPQGLLQQISLPQLPSQPLAPLEVKLPEQNFSPLPDQISNGPMLSGLLSPCAESVCLDNDDHTENAYIPTQVPNTGLVPDGLRRKEKKEIKAQNLRREKPRQTPLPPTLLPTNNPPSQFDVEMSPSKDTPIEVSDDEVNADLMEVLNNIQILPARASMDRDSTGTEVPLVIDDDVIEELLDIPPNDVNVHGKTKQTDSTTSTPQSTPVKVRTTPPPLYFGITTPVKDTDSAMTTPQDTPLKSLLSPVSKASIESGASREIGPINSGIYTCKVCKKDFVKRPEVIMHIICDHMQERFPDVPHLIDERYQCPHNDCNYNSPKRNGLLAHLTLKHAAINISDVTDLIIHDDEQLHKAAAIMNEPRNPSRNSRNPSRTHSPEVSSSDQANSPEKVKISKVKLEPGAEQPLQVKISKRDQTSFSWKCKGCQENFMSEDGLRQHIIMTHLQKEFDSVAPKGLKIYSCEQCFKYSTVSRSNFIKHMGMQHQVVREEMVGQYVEQSESLLLSIDVITCRCDKQFEKQRQLREHIIFTHYKNKFKGIPKGKKRYRCTESGCPFKTHSRGMLIKHLVSDHEALTQKEIKKFIPTKNDDSRSADDSTSDESVIEDDSSVDFDDSVSQVPAPVTENKKLSSSHSEEIVSLDSDGDTPSSSRDKDIPFANNTAHECPVCGKLVAQRSNFEDHLQTHGVEQDPVFQCGECEMVTSFAQLYLHLASVHSRTTPQTSIKVACLSCEDSWTATSSRKAIRWLRTHCTEPTSKAKHHTSTLKYASGARQALHLTYRYSCQLCTMYFKTTETLAEHGKKFNSRCFRPNQGSRKDPIYTCHLCDSSKAAKQFPSHVAGTQHQHKVRVESTKHRDLYGIGPKDHFYSCENCLVSASLDTITTHLRSQPSNCLHMMCGPCGLDVEGKDSEGLTFYLQQHVLTDHHKHKIQKFRDNMRTGTVPAFLMKYRFCCESCSASFTTYSNLTTHSNCPRTRFCCVPCNYTSQPADFAQHLRSMIHARAVATPTSLQSEVSTAVPSTMHDNEVEEVIDVDNSPPGVQAPTKIRSRSNSAQPFRQPNLPAGISVTTVPASEVSVMEVRASRVDSSQESIIDVASSVVEVDSAPMAIQPVRVRTSPGPSNQQHGNPRLRGPLPMRHTHQRNKPSLTIAPQANNQQFVRPQASNGSRMDRSNILYTCQPCKLSFADPGKFQAHATWHEKAGSWSHLNCRVCKWQVQGERLSKAITEHLFHLDHTVKIAKRSGAIQ